MFWSVNCVLLCCLDLGEPWLGMNLWWFSRMIPQVRQGVSKDSNSCVFGDVSRRGGSMPRFLQTFNFGRLALLLAMLSGVAISQTQLGQISGSIVDPAGALVAGAKVTVTNVATGTREVTDTNNEGLFTVANVALGDYEVAVEKEGFRRSVKRLRVEIAQRVNLT